MTPLIQQARSAPATSAKPQADKGFNADSQRHAWKREMERAQSEAWFKAQPTTRAAIPHHHSMARHLAIQGLDTTCAGLNPTSAVVPGNEHLSHSAASAERPSSITQTSPALPVVSVTSGGTAPSIALQLSAAVNHQPSPLFTQPSETPNLQPPSVTKPRMTALTMPGQRNPVRMYTQWNGNEVSIWLGLDADPSAQATRLIETLRIWLRSQGLRPVTIVCNGQLAYRADDATTSARASSNAPASQPEIADHFFHIIATRET